MIDSTPPARALHHPLVLRAVGGIDSHQIHWRNVEIPAGAVTLPGRLMVPPAPRGFVVFASGRGANRRSPRDRRVASALNAARYGTLLFDLWTAGGSDHVGELEPEAPADRLLSAVHWITTSSEAAGLEIGLLGASTGVAAALATAARAPDAIGAVVASDGRPDLAAAWLSEVRAPTLLIVGGDDELTEALNRDALALLRCNAEIVVIPRGAAAPADVARIATSWFDQHLARFAPIYAPASSARTSSSLSWSKDS